MCVPRLALSLLVCFVRYEGTNTCAPMWSLDCQSFSFWPTLATVLQTNQACFSIPLAQLPPFMLPALRPLLLAVPRYVGVGRVG